MKLNSRMAWYIFLCLSVLSVVFWSFILTRQARAIKAYGGKTKVNALQADLERERLSLKREEEFLENYIAAGHNNTGFLEKIGALNKQFHITFLSIGPIIRQSSGKYIKSSRKIVFETDFLELVRCLNNIEKAKGINVSDLSIEPEGTEKAQYIVELTVNTFSLKETSKEKTTEGEKMGGIQAREDSPVHDVLGDVHKNSLMLSLPALGHRKSFMQRVIARDPFSESVPQVKMVSVTAGAEETAAENPGETSGGGLYLTGIITYPHYRVAIVEHKGSAPQVLKRGDSLEGSVVEQVEEDRLILGRNGKSYVIKIGEQLL